MRTRLYLYNRAQSPISQSALYNETDIIRNYIYIEIYVFLKIIVDALMNNKILKITTRFRKNDATTLISTSILN